MFTFKISRIYTCLPENILILSGALNGQLSQCFNSTSELMACSFTLESCVRGYHVYQDTWLATDGEILDCVIDILNRNDPFSGTVKKNVEVVGHVPRHYSCVFSLFLRNDGVILSCCVNGDRRYSRDLPQGGLEIPCIYTFKTNNRDFLDRTKKQLEELDGSVSTIKEDVINAKVDVVCTDNKGSYDLESVSTTDMDTWIKIKDIVLTNFDRRLIADGEKLSDKHINSVKEYYMNNFLI